MTFEEQQEFKILSALKDKDHVLIGDLDDMFENKMAGGMFAVINRLEHNGLIKRSEYLVGDIKSGVRNQGFSITKTGEYKIIALQKINRTKCIKEVAFWILFAASVTSAVYSILSYYFSDKTSSQPLQKSETRQEQPVVALPQTKRFDSIMETHAYPDSVSNGKNVTKKLDTAALRHNPKQLK